MTPQETAAELIRVARERLVLRLNLGYCYGDRPSEGFRAMLLTVTDRPSKPTMATLFTFVGRGSGEYRHLNLYQEEETWESLLAHRLTQLRSDWAVPQERVINRQRVGANVGAYDEVPLGNFVVIRHLAVLHGLLLGTPSEAHSEDEIAVLTHFGYQTYGVLEEAFQNAFGGVN